MTSSQKKQRQRHDLCYRRKILFKHFLSKSYDLDLKRKQNERQRKCRRLKRKAGRSTTIVVEPLLTTLQSATITPQPTTTKSILRKAEGLDAVEWIPENWKMKTKNYRMKSKVYAKKIESERNFCFIRTQKKLAVLIQHQPCRQQNCLLSMLVH